MFVAHAIREITTSNCCRTMAMMAFLVAVLNVVKRQDASMIKGRFYYF